MEKFKSLGSWLKDHRLHQEYSQVSVADAVGITRAAIAQFELGRTLPSENTLEKICGFLSLDFHEAKMRLQISRAERFQDIDIVSKNLQDYIKSKGTDESVADPESVEKDTNRYENQRSQQDPSSMSVPTSEATSNFAQVPLVSTHLSAGNGTFIEAENIESFIMFRKDWLNSKGGKNGKYALLVDGDSMEPEIRDGDLVLIDTSEDGRRPRPGKIFAARQLNTIVIKRLMPDEAKENIVRLISENPAYPPITIDLADSSNKILGRVIWVAREL